MKMRAFIEKQEANMVHDLIELINIPSVLNDPEPQMPFGNPIHKALLWSLDQCKAIGMTTYLDPEGYYGYAEMGEGKETIGLLVHVDVVPGGDEAHWKFGPFNGKLDAGKVYGRGAIDDKGPLIALIYAIKALQDSQVPMHKKVRLIFGTDEETHWRGICKYVEKELLPDVAFTPDASFPMVYAEKGLLQIRLKSKTDTKNEPLVKGGSSLNAVPENAIYIGPNVSKLENTLRKMGFDFESNGEEVVVIGKSAHTSTPQLGVNAIVRMAMALYQMGTTSRALDFIYERLGYTCNGELIFGNCSDDVSGPLTLSLNQMDLSPFGISMGIDIRMPVTIDEKFILEGVKRVAEKYGLEVEVLDALPPIFLSKDEPMIQILRSVFEEETGLDSEPIAIGGATYARAIPNCIAFGPVFPGQSKVAHRSDEFIEVKSFIKMTQIYAKSLERLLKA